MKAILIVDIPKEFENREPYSIEGTLFCHIDDYYTNYRYVCNIGKTKLKPMPQKKKNKDIIIKGKTSEILKARYEGWNDCIDEILGEQE